MMMDPTTERGKIVFASLRLAERRPWSEIALLEIAAEAGITLSELRALFDGKPEILAAFSRMVDDEVAGRAGSSTGAEGARDRLFDTLMTRFETLAPYRAALRSIAGSIGAAASAVSLPSFVTSQTWMLHAAGIASDGPLGKLKVLGVASVYARVFPTFLDDDDPGLARTMAALDRNLRSGERWMTTASDLCGGVERLFGPVKAAGERRRGTREEPPVADVAGNGSGI